MQTTRVVLLSPDLMFGSKVEQMIFGAGAEPVMVQHPTAAAGEIPGAKLLIVDLTTDEFDGTRIVAPPPVPTLGFYAHTDDQTRRAALESGFDLVVPRSRMMREGVDLIASLIAA